MKCSNCSAPMISGSCRYCTETPVKQDVVKVLVKNAREANIINGVCTLVILVLIMIGFGYMVSSCNRNETAALKKNEDAVVRWIITHPNQDPTNASIQKPVDMYKNNAWYLDKLCKEGRVKIEDGKYVVIENVEKWK